MKCTNKEQENCEGEKMGCEGCYYNNSSDKNVINIEECINKLKEYIEYDKSHRIVTVYDKKPLLRDIIENLLTDYERQKQINEEHQKINGELREKVKELDNSLSKMYDNDNLINKLNEGSTFTSNQMKFIYKNFIKKQKIKDKIEELKDNLKHYNDYSKLNLLEKVNVDLIDARIEVLEKLLKEIEE